MVTKQGKFLHIDFGTKPEIPRPPRRPGRPAHRQARLDGIAGHFLGNSKYFLGFNRDIAPFVLTPEMVHVMGGPGSENYNKFKDLKVPGTLGVFRPFAGARALA
jgi:phosphatidylinositol kinase/protein kinase (PI-3  family)